MMTVDTILDLCVQAHPNKIAVTLDDQVLSFSQVNSRAAEYAAALHAWGVGRGDIVLCFANMSLDYVCLYFAISRIGAIFCPLDAKSAEPELQQAIDYLQPGFLVADESCADMAVTAVAGQSLKVGVLAVHNDETPGMNLGRLARSGLEYFRGEGPHATDIHAMFFTSGSTGRPKAVMISHQAFWLRAYVAVGPQTSRGMVCMFPLFHMAGWLVIVQSWARGRTVHLVQKADADSLLGTVEKYQAAILYAIPAVWKRILECGNTYDCSSLLAVDAGTSYVGWELISALRDRFPGVRNLVAYGSTEMGMGLQLAHDDIERKPGSVGHPGPTIEARIKDGELQLRGPTMFAGYYRLESETAEVMDDGWYCTGDMAEVDADGFYSITGRRREVIRSGGKTISPIEVDAALKELEGFTDIAAVGLPDPDWGEIVCAAFVREPGQPAVTIETLRERLTGLSSYKLPRHLVEVSAIPRTPATGQVRRNQLLEMILAG